MNKKIVGLGIVENGRYELVSIAGMGTALHDIEAGKIDRAGHVQRKRGTQYL